MRETTATPSPVRMLAFQIGLWIAVTAPIVIVLLLTVGTYWPTSVWLPFFLYSQIVMLPICFFAWGTQE